MEVIKITPRGYCHGVVSAINIAVRAAKDETLPKPLHILGMIVHNKHVTDALDELGVITIESKNKSRIDLLDDINEGTVIFTAHGVSPAVYQKAEEKGLKIIDASCSDVKKTHDLIKSRVNEGFKIIYIGKKGHPETEGSINVASEHTTLVTSIDEVKNLNLDTDKILITNQTTLSLWDVVKIVDSIKEKYPTADFFDEICDATSVRQDAVANTVDVDLIVVVGDPKSNNTNKLAEIAKTKANVPSVRVSTYKELDINLLKTVNKVAVTSGASTPTRITKNVVTYLEQFDAKKEHTWYTLLDESQILPKIR